MTKIAGSGSVSRGMDPRIRIHTKMSGIRSTDLKVVTNEKQGGIGNLADDRYWSWTVVIDVLFSFYLAAILE
jgi:hypothetical protein